MTRNQKTLIDRAASALGRNRSDFMIEAACQEAESVLLDGRYFVHSEAEFKRFTAMLDKPPASNPRLERLLRTKTPRGKVGHDEIQFSAPEKLAASHDVSQFVCGEAALDTWLSRRALQNEQTGASRTLVLCAGHEIAGYYALATGAIAHAESAGLLKRNTLDPVPVIIIARLAIAARFQGRGIGTTLRRDAVLCTIQAAEIAGIRAILVHAVSEQAKCFYEKQGFIPSPADPMPRMN